MQWWMAKLFFVSGGQTPDIRLYSVSLNPGCHLVDGSARPEVSSVRQILPDY